jgi:capsular exopolysaccharide synthesis family protein
MIAKALALRAKAGLSHVLNGVSPWEDAVVEVTGIPNLCVISGGPVPLNPYDLIASERMRSLAATLREKFDRVVIDSPPVIPFSDARQLSSLCDAVIVVSRYGVTTRRAMERCAESLEEVQARIAGVVLNGIDHRSPDYHYYNYGYSKRRNGDFHGYPMSDVQSESEPSEPEPKRRATGA